MLNVLFLLPQLLVAPMCVDSARLRRRARSSEQGVVLANSTLNMGITDSHQEKLQAWVNKYNVALFVRVSDLTSVNLIDTDKFACKSVDIHDKSSNWGPQQGAVPVDPFFNKKSGESLPSPDSGMSTECEYGDYETPKCTKVPTENILEVRADAISHAESGEEAIESLGPQGDKYRTRVAAIQLVLTQKLIQDYKTAGTLEDCPANTCPDRMQCVVDNRERIKADDRKARDGYIRGQKFCLAPNSATDSSLLEVFWQSRRPGKENEGTIHPLYVWGYNGSPVTGDYDLWLVAPHMNAEIMPDSLSAEKKWQYMTRLNLYDVRGGIGKSGSMMTPLIHEMLYGEDPEKNMNVVLGRSDKPVFHHGAEAQNFYFLQPLDSAVAMIVPNNRGLPESIKTGGVMREAPRSCSGVSAGTRVSCCSQSSS